MGGFFGNAKCSFKIMPVKRVRQDFSGAKIFRLRLKFY
jgi:hypothetical protein